MESKLGAKTTKRCSTIHQSQALHAGFLLSPRKRPKRQPQPYEVPRFVAKDLRIKRVFSRNLPDGNGASAPSGEQISGKQVLIISETSEVRNVDVCNSNVFVELGDEEQRFNGKSEELVHSTPPDAEILAVPSSDGFPLSKADTRIDSVTRTGSVLKPCFKRKLFKAPGSLAYKRLLPFLLDSDNYTLQGDSYPKHENNLEKKPNVEYNLPNHAKELCFVDSDIRVKKAVFPSGMRPNLPPPDNGDTKNFQNGNPSGNQKCSDSNNDLNLVKGDCGLEKDNVVCASSHDKGMTENGGLTKHETEHASSNEQSKTSRLERLDGGNSFISSSVSSEVENFKLYDSKKLSNNVSEDIKSEDYLNKELQMSSLDSNISCYPVKEERRDEKVDQNLGGSTVGENHSNVSIESDKKHGSFVRNKSVRNPLVQLKLFAGQVSVSYRRMLPFLEDIFKDNSENCALENIDCPRPEKELATLHLQPPSSNSHNSLDKSEGLVSCNKPCDGNSDTLATVSKTTNGTVRETENFFMPAEVNDELLSPPKLQMHQLHSEQQLHGAAVLNDQAVSSSNPAASYEPLTGEGSIMISKQLPITSEDCTSLTDNVLNSAKLSERNSLVPNSSGVEACILPENCINVKKGILKRNPRGCRGICTCLNCSAFRLHAERAFEFSRNQLQDAEEVASDLMKEISFLRDVLEKFSDGVKGDAGYHSTKVKEACRKASEAELIAKGRFVQMNYELDIHCRITCSQRPNVRFSCDVEKRENEDGK